MAFYFLVLFIALASIIGIVNSKKAREKFHLQPIYEWSVKALQQQLRKYELLISQALADENDEIVEIVVVEQTETGGAALHSDSIEEIQGIRLGQQPQDDIKSPEGHNNEELATNANGMNDEDRDKVLAAINASLRRLSKAATSGRINGAQLYEILLQETKLHEKNAMQTDLGVDTAAGSASVGNDNNVAPDSVTTPNPKMYFGEQPPLEYVPHNSN